MSGLGIRVFPRETSNFAFRANGVRSAVPKIKKVQTLASPTPGVRNNKFKRKVWQDCAALVIDEISMLDADLFDKLNHIAKEVLYIYMCVCVYI